MRTYVKNKWKTILKDTSGSPEYFYLTPILYLFSKKLKFFIEKYQAGTTLDIGSGHSPYRFLCNDKKYINMDISKDKTVNIVADAHILPFKDETFDTILCLLVLEHTKRPLKILGEINRVLKHSGTLILAVPHITYLHDEPNDYYRFTKYGLTYICEESGLQIKEILPIGGIFSLCGSFISKILLTVVYKIPIIYEIASFINKLFIHSISYMDEHIDKNKIFALNYISIVKKTENIYNK